MHLLSIVLIPSVLVLVLRYSCTHTSREYTFTGQVLVVVACTALRLELLEILSRNSQFPTVTCQLRTTRCLGTDIVIPVPVAVLNGCRLFDGKRRRYLPSQVPIHVRTIYESSTASKLAWRRGAEVNIYPVLYIQENDQVDSLYTLGAAPTVFLVVS